MSLSPPPNHSRSPSTASAHRPDGTSSVVVVRPDATTTMDDLERENAALIKSQQALVSSSDRARRQVDLLEAENEVVRRNAKEAQLRVNSLQAELQQMAERLAAAGAGGGDDDASQANNGCSPSPSANQSNHRHHHHHHHSHRGGGLSASMMRNRLMMTEQQQHAPSSTSSVPTASSPTMIIGGSSSSPAGAAASAEEYINTDDFSKSDLLQLSPVRIQNDDEEEDQHHDNLADDAAMTGKKNNKVQPKTKTDDATPSSSPSPAPTRLFQRQIERIGGNNNNNTNNVDGGGNATAEELYYASSPDPCSPSPPHNATANELETSRAQLFKSCTPDAFNGRLWERTDNVWELKQELKTVWESRRRFDQLLKAALVRLRDAENEIELDKERANRVSSQLDTERGQRRAIEDERDGLRTELNMLRQENGILKLEMQQLQIVCSSTATTQQQYLPPSSPQTVSVTVCSSCSTSSGNNNGNGNNKTQKMMQLVEQDTNTTTRGSTTGTTILNNNNAEQQQQQSTLMIKKLERELAAAKRRESQWKLRHDELLDRLQRSTDALVDRFADPLKTGGKIFNHTDATPEFLQSLASPKRARA